MHGVHGDALGVQGVPVFLLRICDSLHIAFTQSRMAG
jgi:hypothetical protein